MTTVRELAEELNMTVHELYEFAPDLPWQEGPLYVVPEREAWFIRTAVEKADELAEKYLS